MGVLTLSQMRTEVESSMGQRSNIDDARRDVWINLAYTDIASGVDWEELNEILPVATVAGVFNYNGPVNPQVIQMVRDAVRDNLLTWVPRSEYFRLARATAQSAPKRWTREKNQISVWPTPDGVYALDMHYKEIPAALAADGDTSVLPSYVDNGLIMLGTAYGLMAVNEDARATFWLNRTVNYLGSRLTTQDFSFLLGGLSQTQPVPVSGQGGNASGS